MDANLALVMLSGLVLFVAGYFLSRRFKEERQAEPAFLPATFISGRGIIVFLSLLMKIGGLVLVLAGIMLMFS